MYYVETLKCFVVATFGMPTEYVHVLGNEKYKMAKQLSGATKIADLETAERLICYYRSSTGDTQDLIVIPMEVTYELIDERN